MTGCSQMSLQVVPSTRQRQLNRPGPTTPPAGLPSSMPPHFGCTALVGRFSLHFHPHCTLTAPSLHFLFLLTAPSLQPHSTLSTPSLHSHCILAMLHPDCTFTLLSLHCHCIFITPSLHYILTRTSLTGCVPLTLVVMLCDRFCDIR